MGFSFAATFALAWGGCGGSNDGYYCDNTGCYSCDGYGCSSVSPPPATSCTSSVDCMAGYICTTNGCSQKCSTSADCAKGLVCKSGVCTPPTDDAGAPVECSKNSDCGAGKECKSNTCVACKGACSCTTAADCGGTGEECYMGSCVTCGGSSGPCPCTTNKDCSGGDVCVAGACEPSKTVCKYSSQCPTGDVCDDGKCLPACSGTTCPSGSMCVKGACVPNPGTGCKTSADCSGSTPFCVSGTCTSACTMDSQCPTGDYCDQGACVVDTRPKPNCTDSSMCLMGQECLDGYCVFTCKTNEDCLLHDARIGVCSSGVCKSATEATPMCTTQADCPAGQDCISNQCM